MGFNALEKGDRVLVIAGEYEGRTGRVATVKPENHMPYVWVYMDIEDEEYDKVGRPPLIHDFDARHLTPFNGLVRVRYRHGL